MLMVHTRWSYCSYYLNNSEFVWSQRLPDLTKPSYFLWEGYLKKQKANNPQTIEELKEIIRTEARRIRPEILPTVMEIAVKKPAS